MANEGKMINEGKMVNEGKIINEGKMIGSQNVISLVMVTLKNLQDTDGSTIRKILNYISQCFPKRAPKRRIIAALKRGVEFGIMKQKRGHYFLPSSDDVSTRRLKSFELHSTIPLSIRRANMRSRGAKKPRRKRQYFYMNRRKVHKVMRKEIRKRRSPTQPYALSEMYYNTDYNDTASSVGFTEDFQNAAHIQKDNNL